MNRVEIRPLADCPGQAAQLAAWHYQHWGHFYDPADWNLASATAELEDHATRRGRPTTLVAMQDEDAVGSVSLVDEDAPEFRGVGDAWLASLFVLPRARGRGIGARQSTGAAAAA